MVLRRPHLLRRRQLLLHLVPLRHSRRQLSLRGSGGCVRCGGRRRRPEALQLSLPVGGLLLELRDPRAQRLSLLLQSREGCGLGGVGGDVGLAAAGNTRWSIG